MESWETQHTNNLSIIIDMYLCSIQHVEAILTFFQSHFQLSLKVLVYYQFQAFMYISMKLTTPFALHSQKMWIHTCMQYMHTNEWQKGVSPLWLLCSKKHTFIVTLAKQFYITCQGLRPHLSNWSNSNSFAITSEIPFGLNSSAYLYAYTHQVCKPQLTTSRQHRHFVHCIQLTFP